MQTIVSLYRKIQSLDTDKVINESFVETASDLTEENKEQLYAGFDKDGNRLQEYQSDVYAQVKNRINPLPGYGNPDLRATGSFYAGMRVDVSGDTLKEYSTDSKNDELEKKYGDIFGLGGEFKKRFLQENLAPALHNKITKITGLSFRK